MEDEMYIYFSLLVAVIGLIFYVLSAEPKRAELSRIAFFAGLLAFLLQMANAHFGIVPR